MSELFDDDDEKALIIGDEDEGEGEAVAEVDKILVDISHRNLADTRRRLENLLEEKRLQGELEDFPEEYA